MAAKAAATGHNVADVPDADDCAALQTGILMFGFYQLLTRAYKGVAVAQLPFEPIPLIRMISHRGLPAGSSPRLVSVVRPQSSSVCLDDQCAGSAHNWSQLQPSTPCTVAAARSHSGFMTFVIVSCVNA